MKKINYIAMLATLLFVSACDKELNVLPTQSIDSELAITNANDLDGTLIGAYDGLSDADVYGGGFHYLSDFIADDREFTFNGTFASHADVWRKSYVATNGQALATWRDAYAAINRANNVLANLDKALADQKNQKEGEALFIRGTTYFGLVSLFAKHATDGDINLNPGVPVVLTPVKLVSDADNKPRVSVKLVYDQIIADLKKAESLLAQNGDPKFADKYAATAMLARVYQNLGNHAAARDAADAVINSGNYELATDFNAVFTDESPGQQIEAIYKINVSKQDGFNSMNQFYASAAYAGRGDVRIQAKHLNLYDANDPRKLFFIRSGSRTHTAKHLDQYGDVIMIRLAEMHLIRGESNFRLGTNVGTSPVNDFNLLRLRAGAPTIGAASLTLDKIYLERKFELAFEGQALNDLKRFKKTAQSLEWNSPKLVMPIPQREIDVNKSLTQNPGY